MPVFDTQLAQKLAQKRPLLGMFVGIPSPALVEMAGYAGFDFVVLDNEHGPAGPETTEGLIRAAACAGVAPLVRVSGAIRQEILRALDIGAAGVQVPQVNAVEQARLIVDAAKYPPLGSRGAAFSPRAAGYGFFGGRAHLEASNAQTVVVAHIETVEAVRQLDDLLAVDGIDAWFIGPTDLSVSMGFPGQPAHPEVRALIEGCLARIDAAGRVPGLMVSSAEEFQAFAARKARYLSVGLTSLVGAAFKGIVGATTGKL
jgi:2-keto-3-deoxy-L-rhamnonate aldolase RhmA